MQNRGDIPLDRGFLQTIWGVSNTNTCTPRDTNPPNQNKQLISGLHPSETALMSKERGPDWQNAHEGLPASSFDRELSRPTKSILKANESAFDLQNYTAPILPTSSSQRRRVSFAPEVTLHQFEFVAQYQSDEKRRETIASIPSSSQDDDAGRKPLPDSSDDDDDDDSNVSFQALETDADKISQGALRKLPQEEIPSNILDDDEQTMELTGQIPVPVLLPVVALSSESDLEEEPDMELTSNFAAPVRLPASTALPEPGVDDPEADHTTVPMELTRIFPSKSQDTEPSVEIMVLDKNEQLASKINDISLSNSPQKALTGKGNIFDTNLLPQPQPSLAPDLANHDQLSQIDEESEMELTQYVLNIKEVLANEGIIELTSPSKPQLNKSSPQDQAILAQTKENPAVRELNDDKQEGDSNTIEMGAAIALSGKSNPIELTTNTELSGGSLDDEDENADDSLFFEKQAVDPTDDTANNYSSYRSPNGHNAQPSNGYHETEMDLQYPHLDDNGVSSLVTPPPHNSDAGSLKRKFDLDNPALNDSQQSKVPRLGEHETSTIPLADVSIQSADLDDEDYVPVSLPDFMSDIGIQFYDDLDIGASRVNRGSLSLTEPKVNLTPEDFYRVSNKMHLFEGYELGCTELNKRIEEGRRIFEDSKEKILDANPRILREFYQSLLSEQLNLKSYFQQIKDYARQQARELWYHWRIETLKKVLESIQANQYVLENDKGALTKNLTLLESIYDSAQEEYFKLKSDLSSFLDIQKQVDELDKAELQNYKTKLNNTSLKLTEYQQQIEAKGHQLEAVLHLIQERDAKVSLLGEEIKNVEDALATRRQYDAAEIALLDTKWKLLQNLSNVEGFTREDGACSFVFDLVVKVQISTNDNVPNIDYSLVESKGHAKFNNSNLLFDYALQLPHISPSEDVFENYSSFIEAWQSLKRLDTDIYKIALKFPVQFERAATQSHIVFSILYFSPELNFKVKFTVEIELRNLIGYASNLSITGKILRANGVSKDSILQTFFGDITKNDLINRHRDISLDGM